MAGDNYYLLSFLPTLGDLGDTPPMSLIDLLTVVADAPGPRTLLQAVFLSDDLVQRRAFLTGELKDVEPVVLTAPQVCDEEPLPDFLMEGLEEKDSRQQVMLDHVSEAYFRHIDLVAQQQKSIFLRGLIGLEVGLRNALAQARAKALGLDPAEYLVAPHLADQDTDFTPIITEWLAAPDPLAGQRVLDRARWTWLSENDKWFSFADDELAVYGAKLMLLTRWHRIGEQKNAETAASQ